MANKYCRKCGAEMPEDANFCTKCGQSFDPEAISYQNRQEKAKEEKKINKKAINAFFVVLGVLLLIVLGSMFYSQYSEKREAGESAYDNKYSKYFKDEISAYENAMMSTEPAVLQHYLDEYLDAPVAHRDSIKAHLWVLTKIDRDWDNARASLSKSALQLFIDRNPDNEHVREAKQMIDSLDFETAKMGDSMESYMKYMEEHQQGYYYDKAKSAYDRLEEEERATEEEREAEEEMRRALNEEAEEIIRSLDN